MSFKFEGPQRQEPMPQEQGQAPKGGNPEGEINPEVKAEIEELNENAESVGEQLDDVDPRSLPPEGVNMAWENMTRVLGAIYMLIGTVAVEQAALAGTDPMHQLDSLEKALAVGLTVGGYAIGVNGFQKLIHGTKKFFGGLTPEQKAEVSS